MYSKIERAISYKFKNITLLVDALSHSSIKKHRITFERLEFLGDRVLGVIIAEYIFRSFKKINEGDMARMHSSLVCADSCHHVAINIGIDKAIKTCGIELRTNKTVMADAMEALLGAIFLDSGFETTKQITLSIWNGLFEAFDMEQRQPKTELQEITQAKNGEIPIYNIVSVDGPDHEPSFLISVEVLGKKAFGNGGSRRIAEAEAAKNLLEMIKQQNGKL